MHFGIVLAWTSEGEPVDRDGMIKVVESVTERQDVGDVDGIVELFSMDCTFMMPVLDAPIRGREQLREHVTNWPKAATKNEWIAVDGNRVICVWSWRGEGWPEDTPLLRGVSTYHFDKDGLIKDYEDFFDPDWATRHNAGAWAKEPGHTEPRGRPRDGKHEPSRGPQEQLKG